MEGEELKRKALEAHITEVGVAPAPKEPKSFADALRSMDDSGPTITTAALPMHPPPGLSGPSGSGTPAWQEPASLSSVVQRLSMMAVQHDAMLQQNQALLAELVKQNASNNEKFNTLLAAQPRAEVGAGATPTEALDQRPAAGEDMVIEVEDKFDSRLNAQLRAKLKACSAKLRDLMVKRGKTQEMENKLKGQINDLNNGKNPTGMKAYKPGVICEEPTRSWPMDSSWSWKFLLVRRGRRQRRRSMCSASSKLQTLTYE